MKHSPLTVRFDVRPGLTMQAAWTTPRVAEVRIVGIDGPGPLVERWSMVSRRTGAPLIEATEAALADLAAYRLARHRGAAELIALVEARGLTGRRLEPAAVA